MPGNGNFVFLLFLGTWDRLSWWWYMYMVPYSLWWWVQQGQAASYYYCFSLFWMRLWLTMASQWYQQIIFLFFSENSHCRISELPYEGDSNEMLHVYSMMFIFIETLKLPQIIIEHLVLPGVHLEIWYSCIWIFPMICLIFRKMLRSMFSLVC